MSINCDECGKGSGSYETVDGCLTKWHKPTCSKFPEIACTLYPCDRGRRVCCIVCPDYAKCEMRCILISTAKHRHKLNKKEIKKMIERDCNYAVKKKES